MPSLEVKCARRWRTVLATGAHSHAATGWERNPMKMEKRSKKELDREPMGIVISGGRASDAPPVFSAYVWGPAPEETRPTPEPRVA